MRISLLLFSLACLVAIAFAREKIPNITVGMEMREVLSIAGQASSKKIMEIKREEEWFYDGYSVLFAQGKVVKFTLVSALNQSGKHEAPAESPTPSSRFSRTAPPDLLRSILKELPVSTGTSNPSQPSAGGVSPLSPASPAAGVPHGLSPMEVNP